MQRTREQGLGSTATVHIFKSVRLPVESAHSPFGLAVRRGMFGSQRSAASLRATDSLITIVLRSVEMFHPRMTHEPYNLYLNFNFGSMPKEEYMECHRRTRTRNRRQTKTQHHHHLPNKRRRVGIEYMLQTVGIMMLVNLTARCKLKIDISHLSIKLNFWIIKRRIHISFSLPISNTTTPKIALSSPEFSMF